MRSDMDILVLGATGFTGRLITQHLFAHPQRDAFTFGIGARSKPKLDALVAQLALDDTVHRVQVDVTDPAQLDAAVTRTRVVINVVGPYWHWGTPVVHACVKHGRHYVDLSGETHWIKGLIHKYDYYATKTGAIVIPSCGFDSMPSDMSAFLGAATAKAILGPDASVESSLTGFKLSGGISGGTVATAVAQFADVDRATLVAAAKSYVLSPVKGRIQRRRLLYTLTPHSPTVQGAFFFMSPSNRAIVQRTWGLHQLELRREQEQEAAAVESAVESSVGRVVAIKTSSYGPRFVYDEFFVTSNVLVSLVINVASAFVALCLATSPIRWLIKRFGPQPGEGPSEKTMKNGYMQAINVTTATATPPDGPPVHIKTVIRGKGDPGYSLTSVMISEAALCIALEYDDLPELGRRGGLLTPMSALGGVLVGRLKASGRFEFESERMDG